MLRSDLYDYNDAYIVVTMKITVEGINSANKRNKSLTFKNNAAFRACLSKIHNTFIGNEEDLHIVMLMYNLLKYSDNYSITLQRLRNDFRDEVIDDANEVNEAGDYRINKNKITTIEPFEYKTKIIGSTLGDNNILGTEVVASLKHLSNFWWSFCFN